MAWDVDYDKVFECVHKVTGLPLRRKGRCWYGKCRINGAPHDRDDKIVVSRSSDGGITILEQGGEVMQLYKWLLRYGGCSTNKDAYDRLKSMSDGVIIIHDAAPIPPKRFVEPEYLLRARSRIGVERNDNLFNWLCQCFDRDNVIDAFKRYNITPCNVYLPQGSSIGTQFWYVNKDGDICHDKMMIYQSNGRRDKSYGGGRIYKTASGYGHRCYFGDHITSSGLTYVVESEKTALLLYLYSGIHTVATGGANALRRVDDNHLLLPDYDDAGQEWIKRHPARCIKWWEDSRNTDAAPGDDYGDVIYRRLLNISQ